MAAAKGAPSVSESTDWRSECKKVDVWYAAYGADVSKENFLCRINGGKVEGMKIEFSGSKDQSPPKEMLWKTFHHHLFFGRKSSRTWGPGGIAFIDPVYNYEERTHMRLYKITLEQFNEVLHQTSRDDELRSVLFDRTHLETIESKICISVQDKYCYSHVLYLGRERDDIPILTMTCSRTRAEKFKSRDYCVRAPNAIYAKALIKGLVKGKMLSYKEANSYINAKVDIWYATYGSDMWEERFLCRIKGGKVEGMNTKFSASKDQSPPKEMLWKTFPYRLFFGRESSHTWGPGGVAFINPEYNAAEGTHMCMYRITLEQFNHILSQHTGLEMSRPLFNATDLDSIVTKRSMPLKSEWYNNVVYLEKERSIHILTLTCSQTDVKSGKYPICAPNANYANALIKGLVKGKMLSYKEANSYINAKVDIWYATYGSDMWEERFLCRIKGGKVEGMNTKFSASKDQSPPKEMLWKTFPHRLFFGRESSHTWGPGGVAFINPEYNAAEGTHMCMYRITLEQFNHILSQHTGLEMSRPLFNATDLDSIVTKRSMPLKSEWYNNVVYLEKERSIHILTLTCSRTNIKNFISGKAPIREPSRKNENALIKGLVKGKKLSRDEAEAYIRKAKTKVLGWK